MKSLKEKLKKEFPSLSDNDFDESETDLYIRYIPEVYNWLEFNFKGFNNINKFYSKDILFLNILL